MSRYQSLRPLGTGLDGAVEEVRPDRHPGIAAAVVGEGGCERIRPARA